MSRGGYREGAGRKSSWNNSETQLIRVPKVFATLLIHMARQLDRGEPLKLVAVEAEPDADSASDSYSHDRLNQIASEMIADPSLVTPLEDRELAKTILQAFIQRLIA
jgi:hypothetical protein